MIRRMLTKLAVVGMFAIALLHAQPITDAERKFIASIDGALGVHPGAVIADIGTGHMLANPVRIAQKVGSAGKVICVDVNPSVIAKIKDYIDAHHVTNIETVLGKEDDPLLVPETCDAILVSNTYHEFTQPAEMLRHIHDALRTHGKLVVLELYSNADKNETRAEQAKHHDMSPDILEQELAASGFTVQERPAPAPISADRFRYLFSAEKSK
jgi:ubiquinone/menaquinone biosynthesis C-methylase UbiE